MDGRDLPDVDIINADKIAHAGCYALFTAFLIYGFLRSGYGHRAILSASLAIAYGLLMEGIQGAFFEYRHFDLWDAAANALGAVLMLVTLPFLGLK